MPPSTTSGSVVVVGGSVVDVVDVVNVVEVVDVVEVDVVLVVTVVVVAVGERLLLHATGTNNSSVMSAQRRTMCALLMMCTACRLKGACDKSPR